ncbi:hypothetical protein GDO86_004593 [Hymenochirus boettgeri]|uniref:Platelet-derived growth factor receptor-like protein n=1 Tax=Hymenochirus boettgeri TaxID=247094 RepID=A0A8T2K8F3_9PIPI|nr:hypothetical protein GDO86_004593 [Hymenochirus boettgeri]
MLIGIFQESLDASRLSIRWKGIKQHFFCIGERRHDWTYPVLLNKESSRLSISNKCRSRSRTVCSRLTVRNADPRDTGYYSCIISRTLTTSVYIFVSDLLWFFFTDVNSPFVETHSDIPDLIYMTEGEELVIPCRVTSPNITVTFKTYRNNVFTLDQKNIIWDNKRGIIIPKPTYVFNDLLSCEVTVNGILHSTKYIPQKQSSKIHSVRLNVSDSIHLLRTEPLEIQCSVTTDLNARAEITWKYPQTNFGIIALIKRIMGKSQPGVNVFNSILTIKEVKKYDEGDYICIAKNGPSTRSVKTTVRIHAKPFINVKPRTSGVLEAVSGDKSFHISMKVRAFPAPEVIWLKDGLPASERCTRYIGTDKYSITIRDVSEEDAGKYTIVLQLKQWKLTKNFTVTLVVNVKPLIYEKSVSMQEPILYPLGSKQSLTCTVYGVPPPTITWHWRPCLHRARCDIHSENTRNSVLLINVKNSSSFGNSIWSITERTQMIEEKNKIAGTLTIDNSRISGVYTCVATNKIGSERREINYYVTDVPNGFHMFLNKEPTEGEDVALTCSVNKFLYTDISLIFNRTIGNRTIHHSIGKQRNSIITEYSINLTAVIKKANPADSGNYICRAKNLYSGEIVQQKKEITIYGEQSSKKTKVSRTKLKRRKANHTTQRTVTH